MTEPVDLRALIQARKSGGVRATIKCLVCIDPDLLPELDELLENTPEDTDKRLAGPKLAAHKKAIADLEERVAAHTVTVVFWAPNREQKAEYDRIARDEASKEDLDLKIVTECFARFERDGKPYPMDRPDWLDLLEVTPPAEVNMLAAKVYARAGSVPDFPESLKRSGPIPA